MRAIPESVGQSATSFSPKHLPPRETDSVSKQHKIIARSRQNNKDLRKIRPIELLRGIKDRIESSNGSDLEEIVSLLLRYRREHVSEEYWNAWRNLVEKFPALGSRLSAAEIGIEATQTSNLAQAISEKEKEMQCIRIIEEFNSLRVNEEPALPKPKNPDFGNFNKIVVQDPYKGRVFEDEDKRLTLFKWEVKAYFDRDPIFQTKLGDYYFSTWPEMARLWYSKASILQYPEASYRRGFCYEFGHAIDEQNFDKATELYKIAAADGCTSALNSLGAILRRMNPKLAFTFFEEAAIRGDLDGMCNLGLACVSGSGIFQSSANAVAFFSAAAEWGHAASLHHLGNCAALGLYIPAQLSLAIRYWGLAAEKGCYESAYNLGRCFYDGVCLPKNYSAAFKWFSFAAQHNQPFAMYWVGLSYKLGHGVEQNIPKSVEVFTKTARLAKYLPSDLQVALYSDLQDQNFDIGFLADEEAEMASW